MTKPDPVKILEELEIILEYGLRFLHAWQEISEKLYTEPELLDLAPEFFKITSLALIEAATLQAAKLTEERDDSVNLVYFFNVVKDLRQGNSSPCGDPLETDREILERLRSTIEEIKHERDKKLAHNDRKFMNSRESRVEQVQAYKLIDLFLTSKGILKKYRALLGVAPTTQQAMEMPSGKAELDELFQLVRIVLDDETVQDISEQAKQTRSMRKARMKIREALTGEIGSIKL